MSDNTILCGGLVLQVLVGQEWVSDIDIFTTDISILDKFSHQDALTAVTIGGPVLINLVVSAWKKAVAVEQDIKLHGVSGCCKRNFC